MLLRLSGPVFALQTQSKLYLVLDFINGGHLFFNLYRQVSFSIDGQLFVSQLSAGVVVQCQGGYVCLVLWAVL